MGCECVWVCVSMCECVGVSVCKHVCECLCVCVCVCVVSQSGPVLPKRGQPERHPPLLHRTGDVEFDAALSKRTENSTVRLTVQQKTFRGRMGSDSQPWALGYILISTATASSALRDANNTTNSSKPPHPTAPTQEKSLKGRVRLPGTSYDIAHCCHGNGKTRVDVVGVGKCPPRQSAPPAQILNGRHGKVPPPICDQNSTQSSHGFFFNHSETITEANTELKVK